MDTQLSGNPFRYAGLEHDGESGLEHAQFRQYTSTFGRWTSPDPYDGSMDVNDPQSLNRYSYVGNMPLNGSDPSGLFWGLGLVAGPDGVGSISATIAAAVPYIDMAIGAIEIGYDVYKAFSHPKFTASHKARPNASPWDEHGTYKPVPFGSVAQMLGIGVQAGCEFGACQMGLAPDHQTASGSNPFPNITSDTAWFWALHADRLGVHGLYTYGNWCGAGGSGNPINALDAACLQHDFCYFENHLTAGQNLFKVSAALQGCNQAPCNTAAQVPASENHQGGDLDEAEAAVNIDSYFGGFAAIVRSGNRCNGLSLLD